MDMQKGMETQMSNTLETKTIDQLHTALISYNSYMCEIPAVFPVLPEYLGGLTETEFCEAFAQLEKIMVAIYNRLNEHPESIGLTVQNRKTGEWKLQSSQHISCVKKLLYVLGRFGKPEGDCLHIAMHDLMNAYMTYYPNCSVELAETIKEFGKEKQEKYFAAKHMRMVFDCLTDFGFIVNGLDVPETPALDILYPTNPALLTVIHALASAKICRISFGFDFVKCNYRVFAHPYDGKLPLCDLYSYQLKNYVEDNGLQQNSTCMIYFSENRKKLEKEATKILSKYKRNRNSTVTRIDTDKFHFIKPEE